MVAAFPARSPPRPHAGPAASRRYERRRPEKTPLFKIVSEFLEGWLENRSARELCTRCPQRFVVAFSCKRRGVCPSCNGRHMAQTAAHLVDHVILPVPVRQWVIPLPKRLRGFLGDRPKAVAAVTRIFLNEIETLLGAQQATPPSTRPRLGGVIELSPFEFLDRLADLIPQPRKHRHRYHGVFAPNHPLRPAVTALAVWNVGKQRDAVTSGHAEAGHDAGDCCGTHATPRSHETLRIARAKLMSRVGEEFPLECPACGGDIRLRGDGRQEPAHFEPEVRKREKARMASPG